LQTLIDWICPLLICRFSLETRLFTAWTVSTGYGHPLKCCGNVLNVSVCATKHRLYMKLNVLTDMLDGASCTKMVVQIYWVWPDRIVWWHDTLYVDKVPALRVSNGSWSRDDHYHQESTPLFINLLPVLGKMVKQSFISEIDLRTSTATVWYVF
jgi:hypothetical protein